jgi:hypothetical protein
MVPARGAADTGSPSRPNATPPQARRAGRRQRPMRVHASQFDEAQLLANARIADATPLFEWIAEDAAAVFSY